MLTKLGGSARQLLPENKKIPSFLEWYLYLAVQFSSNRYVVGADEGTWTPTPKNWFLRPARLPISPHPPIYLILIYNNIFFHSLSIDYIYKTEKICISVNDVKQTFIKINFAHNSHNVILGFLLT